MSRQTYPGDPMPTRPLASLPVRLARWLGQAYFRDARPGRLPITDLPGGVGEVPPGEVALLLCADPASREQLLLCLLAQTLARRRVTWVSGPTTASFAVGPGIRAAAWSQHLLPLAWTQDAETQLRQLEPMRLLRELASSGMRSRDLLVLDAMDPWLAEMPEHAALESGIDEATQHLLRWAKGHQGPVLALAPAHCRGQALLPLLAHNSLSRLAVLRVDGSTAHLEVVRWGEAWRARAPNQAADFLLDLRPAGGWQCRRSTVLDPLDALTAEDAATIHATRSAVHDAPDTPAGWRVHASLEALLAAADDAVAATVVLAHDSPEAVVVLADAVYRLRRQHPHLLKIIVRETGPTLRKNGELALLRLGANAVVGRDTGFSHLAQLVGELRGQAYTQSQPANPTRTLQTLAPDPIQGYLAPREFCTAVERMLERTAGTQLEHSLVQMPLLPHVAHLDALLACQARRDGDVVSADARGLFIFLFGCPHRDVMTALESLFAIPCSELAQHVQIEPDASSQRLALARLRRATDESPADYSAILLGIAPGARPAPVQARVLPTHSPEAARCVQAHVLPLRAATA